MPSRFEKYRMKDGLTRLGEAFFNPVLQDIDLRIGSVEALRISWEDAVRAVNQYGLVRINDVLAPAFATASETSIEIESKRLEAIAALAALLALIDNYEAAADADIVAWKAAHLAEISALIDHVDLINNPHSVTAAQVGLGNANNTADADKPVSTAQQTALDAKVGGPAVAVDGRLAQFDGASGKLIKDGGLAIGTSTSLAENSDSVVPTQKAVKAYADALIAATDAMVFKGATNCSANPNYPAGDAGHTYRVSGAGKIGGAAGKAVEVGDLYICTQDGTAAGAEEAVGAYWTVVQTNLDGAVIGPAAAVNLRIAIFDGASGKLIKDSGVLLSQLATLAGNTFTGAQVFSDQQASRAMLIDCGWTFLDKGNSSTAAQALDYPGGQHQKVTATGNFTLSTTNWPPTGNLGELLLELVNGGAFTITWPTINWIKPDGTMTTSISTYLAANIGRTALQSAGTDFVLLWSRDAGATVFGKLV